MTAALRVPAAAFLAALLPLAARATESAPETFPDRAKAFGGVPFGATIDEAKKAWQLEQVEGASVPDDPVSIDLREEESLVLGGLVAREVIY
jgi:hypothetical protein